MVQLPDRGSADFYAYPYVHPQNGQTYRAFDITRNGFTLLAMGFTGAKALKFKLAYIAEFNAMEGALKASPPVSTEIAQLAATVDQMPAPQITRERRQSRILTLRLSTPGKPKTTPTPLPAHLRGLYLFDPTALGVREINSVCTHRVPHQGHLMLPDSHTCSEDQRRSLPPSRVL